MKNKIVFFILLLVPIFLISGCKSRASAQDITNDSLQLILSLSAKYTGSIGWGDIYKCKVKEVKKGNIEDTTIFLYIIVNNYESIFSRGLAQPGKVSADMELQLIAHFNEIENDKPYVNFKNAFIDQKKRTWELVDLKNENK
ncbi:MAG: hypothetical protein ABIJ97_05970 [Bacteroidota bacterium]